MARLASLALVLVPLAACGSSDGDTDDSTPGSGGSGGGSAAGAGGSGGASAGAGGSTAGSSGASGGQGGSSGGAAGAGGSSAGAGGSSGGAAGAGGGAAGSAPQVCAPGKQEACACPGSTTTGAQTCNAEGTGWGACEGCPGGQGGAGGASGAAGSSGQQGGAGGEAGASGSAGSGGVCLPKNCNVPQGEQARCGVIDDGCSGQVDCGMCEVGPCGGVGAPDASHCACVRQPQFDDMCAQKHPDQPKSFACFGSVPAGCVGGSDPLCCPAP